MGEEKNRVLPEALNYQGLLVVTTKQLTELYHCTRQNIDNLFRKYKNDFIEGEDYFKVDGKDLRVLKNQFAEQSKLTAARQLKLTTNLIDEREKSRLFQMPQAHCIFGQKAAHLNFQNTSILIWQN